MRFVAGLGALLRRAIGKILLAGGAAGGMERSGSLNGRACRSAEAAAMQQMHRSRCDAADAQKPLRCSRCTEAATMQQMHRSSSARRQKETSSKHRSLAQKKQPGTEACDPNAGCARKITIRVNILLTLQPIIREATTCGVARHLRSNNLRSSPPPAKQPPAEQPAAAGRSAT